jgi:glycosyltransferase involved in cell wall biosynthesis
MRWNEMKREWVINGRFLSQPISGVQRYAREIVKSLDDALRENHPFAEDLSLKLVLPPGANALLGLSRIEVVDSGRAGGHLWEQVHLPAVTRRGLISLCNSGPIWHPRQIVCIHDLNTRVVPASYSLPFRTLYRALIPALGRSAILVSTVSNYSANQLSHFRICNREKIRVIPNGSDHALNWKPVRSKKIQAAAGNNTIVVLGSRAPHKNLELMLKIADDLAELGLRLAVVGASNPKVFAPKSRVLAAAHQPGNVVWLGRISDNELAALLADCLCLAFPSLTEGFGLPPIEALARGCPVVVSDRASLPEVCGRAVLYAAPDDPDAWLRQFRRLVSEPDLHATLASGGPPAAARYTWRRSAEMYLSAMAECDGIDISSDNARMKTSLESRAASR